MNRSPSIVAGTRGSLSGCLKERVPETTHRPNVKATILVNAKTITAYPNPSLPNARKHKGKPRFPVLPEIKGIRKVRKSNLKINVNIRANTLTTAYAMHTTIIISVRNFGFIVFCVSEVKTNAGTASVIASLVTNSTRYSKPNFTQKYPIAARRNTGVTTSNTVKNIIKGNSNAISNKLTYKQVERK
tara:strand:+ start:99 stop:659 length:561 start_codon:yes stop_codon:yes gene_type:complete